MKVLPKSSARYSPFNCIAMGDIKSKDTGKGGFRQLSDCVASLSEGVTKLQEYLKGSPDQTKSAAIDSHVKAIIGIQKELLKMCESEIDRQGVAPAPGAVPEESPAPAVAEASPSQAAPLPASSTPKIKAK